jgi:hypothetical protein
LEAVLQHAGRLPHAAGQVGTLLLLLLLLLQSFEQLLLNFAA